MKTPVWMVLAAVASGAGAGACCRWALSEWLNRAGAAMPLGTLCANMAGGYLIGLVTAWILATPSLPPLAKPLLVTGFLGGLTTFSTYSLEALTLLNAGRILPCLGMVLAHNAGSIAAAAAGMLTWRLLH